MIITEATTQYKKRKWQVVSGGKVTVSFPPGPEGKRLAQLEALEINRPDLATLVHRAIKANQDPKAFNMALKAAHIIRDDLLYVGTCHSQSRAGVFHTITYNGQPKGYHCTCETFSYCAVHIEDIGFVCKHCLADHWAYLLGIDLPQQPIPFGGGPIAMTRAYFSDQLYDEL